MTMSTRKKNGTTKAICLPPKASQIKDISAEEYFLSKILDAAESAAAALSRCGLTDAETWQAFQLAAQRLSGVAIESTKAA